MWFGKENKKNQLIDVALDLQREAETREAVAKAAREMGLKDEYLKAAQKQIDEEARKKAQKGLNIDFVDSWHMSGWAHMGIFALFCLLTTICYASASGPAFARFATCWALVLVGHLAYVGYTADKLIKEVRRKR